MIGALKADAIGTLRALREALWAFDLLARAAIAVALFLALIWGVIHGVMWLAGLTLG